MLSARFPPHSPRSPATGHLPDPPPMPPIPYRSCRTSRERAAGTASASDEALADRAAEEVFGSEDNTRNTAGLITSFVASWERHKHEKPPAVWLADELRSRAWYDH